MKKIVRVVLISSVLAMLLACSEGMTESQHLEKAIEYSSKGNFNAASIELKNALQKNPDNPQARFELAKLYLKLSNLPGAEKEFSRAMELGVENKQVLPLLSRALLYQGKHDKVLALPMKELDDAGRADVFAMKGLSQLAQNNESKARFLIDKSLEINNKSVFALFANAAFHAFKGDMDQAKAQLEALFKIDPEYGRAWSLLGDIEMSNRKLDLALEAFNKSIELRPNNMVDMLKRAMLYLQTDKTEEAQKDLDILKETVPLHPGYNYVQGVMHFLNTKYQDAQSSFDLAMVDEANYPKALYFGGLTSFILGQDGRAQKYATKYFNLSPDFPPVRKLLALMKVKESKLDEAVQLLLPIIDSEESDQGAMRLLSGIYLKQGKTNESIELLSKVAELNPDSHDAQMRLGVGLMASGNDAAGEAHLATAKKLDPSNKNGDIILILNYIRQKKHDLAIKTAIAYREQYPSEASSHNVLARVYTLTGKFEEAVASYNKALELEPGELTASKSLAELAIANKEFDKARKYYNSALEKHENHLQLLVRLAAIDSLEGKARSMVGHLERALEAHPNALAPRLLLSRFYYSIGLKSKVPKLVGEFGKARVKVPGMLELIALGQLAQSEYTSAKLTLEELLKKNPRSAEGYHRLANVYAGLNKPKEMRAALEKSIELAPKYIPPRLALARTMMVLKQDDQVAEQLGILKKISPNHPEVMQVEALYSLQQGNLDKARAVAQEAYEAASTSSNLLVLAKTKWASNDREGSINLSKEWLEKFPDDLKVRLDLAGKYLIQGDESSAVEHYTQVLNRQDTNLVALNNLAWYLRNSDPVRALKYAKYANDIAPKKPALMDTLAMVLLAQDQVDEAKGIIKEALIKAPRSTAIRYHAAKIMAAAGDKGEAVRILDNLLSEKNDYPEKKDAEKLLSQLQ